MCFVTEKEVPCNHHLPDPFVRDDPRGKESLQFLWVLVYCLLYLVTYGLHRNHSINNHKVVAELRLNCKKEGLVVHRVPCEWALFDNFDNVNDEYL